MFMIKICVPLNEGWVNIIKRDALACLRQSSYDNDFTRRKK